MGGPGASILLPRPLSDLDRTSIDNSLHRQGLFPNPWNHALDWYFGGSELIDDPRDLPADVAQFFGFNPADVIQVDARCNRLEDHHMLGEFSASLAEQFGGIVDYGGALWPRHAGKEAIDFHNVDWRQIEPLVSPILARLPGRLLGLIYETYSGRQWVCHYGDANFARAWLKHPSFRMKK